MKTIGFIKEHNSVYVAKPFLEYLTEDDLQPDRQKIIDYLTNGYLIDAWMGYFVDIYNNEPIAPDSYYSDGLWVWPSYLVHYMEKYPNFTLDGEFIQYLRNKNFQFHPPIDFDKLKYELELQLNNLFKS